MRYVALLLLAASTACNFDGLLTGFNPFVVQKPTSGSHIELTSVAVSPATLPAGSQFVASASITFAGCSGAPVIVVNYGNQWEAQQGPAFQWAFAAILNDTIVDFHAYCVTPSGGPISTPNQDIHITVAPAP